MKTTILALFMIGCTVGSDGVSSIENRPSDDDQSYDAAELQQCVLDAIESGETEPVDGPAMLADGAGCNYIGVTAAVNNMLGQGFDICVYSWCESVFDGCLDCAGGRALKEIHECY